MNQEPQQNPAVQNRLVRFSNFCGGCFEAIGNLVYSTKHLLVAQILVSLFAAQVCALMTRAQSPQLKFALTLGVACNAFYLFILYYSIKYLDTAKDWFTDLVTSYWVYYHAMKPLVIIGLIRVFVLVAAALENEKDLDGFSTGFFLLSYLHIVSLCKLFDMEDFICLSDSILGIGIFVAARLDHYHGTTELCDLNLRNATVHAPAPAPSSDTISVAGFVGRAVASYVSAVLLVCFRFSNIPFGNLPAVAPTVLPAVAPTVLPADSAAAAAGAPADAAAAAGAPADSAAAAQSDSVATAQSDSVAAGVPGGDIESG